MNLNLPTNVPVIDEGDGLLVVMLHGAPDHRHEWQGVIERLSTQFRCLAPDLLGFGYSPKAPPEYDFSIDAQVQFFDGWVNQMIGSEPFILVAHDIGAMMGMAWAALNPERVRGMVIMNTVLHADYEWHTMARLWSQPILGRLFMFSLNKFAWRLAFRRDFPQVTQAQVDSMYSGLTYTARLSLLRHFRQMTHPNFFVGWEEELRAVTQTVPTTVLWGDQDPLIPQSYAPRLGGQLKRLADCGHWVPLEKPQQVAQEVLAIHHLASNTVFAG